MIIVFNGASNIFMSDLCDEVATEVESIGLSVIKIDSLRGLIGQLKTGKIGGVISPATSPLNVVISIFCRLFGAPFMVGIHDVVSHESKDGFKVFLYNKALCFLAHEILVFSEFSRKEILLHFDRSAVVYLFGLRDDVDCSVEKDIDVLVFGRMLSYQGVERLPELCDQLDDLRVVLASRSLVKEHFDNLSCEVIPEFISSGHLHNLVSRSKVVMLPYMSATQSGHIPFAIARGCVPVVTDVGALAEQVSPIGTTVLRGPFSTEKFAALVRTSLMLASDVYLFRNWMEEKRRQNSGFGLFIRERFIRG